MHKRIFALLLSLCLLLSAVPVYAGAATGQLVSANAVTVTAGNTATVTLKAENFAAIAALDVYVFYDASALSVSSTTNGTLLSSAQSSVNTAEAGKITLSLMSLTGISGTGNLLTIRFATTASTDPGTYPITVAIGRAYDSNLQVAEVAGVNGSVTVSAPVETETFTIYGYPSTSSLQKGSVLSYRVAAASSRSFVSGEFLVTYDHEVFAFESATLESALTKEGAIYSVNSSVLGQVRIVYANDDPVESFYLFTVKLKVIADMDGKTTIKANANNIYRENLTAYLPGSRTDTLTLTKLPQVVDYPNAFLRTDTLVVGKESHADFCLEAGAGVAAADFTLTYDPSVLRCVSVTQAEGLGEKGGMVVINDNYQNGTIRFSYVNMDAYSQEDLPLVRILWEPICSPDRHYSVSLGGVGVVDANQKSITLEYVTDSDCIYVATVIPPCEADGYTLNTCACGNSFQDQFVPMEGHILEEFAAKEPTCLEPGWTAHVGCTRCDYKTVELLSPLGHDYIFHDYQSPTCTESGWYSYDTCSRCDYSTYSEIPALGHRTFVYRPEWVDPICVELGDDAYPFEYVDGVYYSTNHGSNSNVSMQIIAIYDCQLTLICGVSSEQYWDNLKILRNGAQTDVISGEVTDRAISFDLTAGDSVTVSYYKDGSVDKGQDRGWVELQFDQIYEENATEIPAEDAQPTCTQPVICSYCNVVVKPIGNHYLGGTSEQGPFCTYCGQIFPVAIYQGGSPKQVYKTLEQAYAACIDNQYILLLWDVQVDLQLDRDLYVDLNGHAMTGTIRPGAYKIYGMDCKTNNYENTNGYLACVTPDGTDLPVEKAWTTTSKRGGSERSYLAVKNDNGWSFNRYFLGLTHVSLKPNAGGVGYKGYYVGNGAVCDALSETNTFGYTLSLEGGLTVSRSIDGCASGRIVTLRVKNFDLQNFGEAMLSAKVFLTLADGTVLESSPISMSMRMILENINAGIEGFSQEQLAAVRAMIEKYPIVKTWDTANLYS